MVSKSPPPPQAVVHSQVARLGVAVCLNQSRLHTPLPLTLMMLNDACIALPLTPHMCANHRGWVLGLHTRSPRGVWQHSKACSRLQCCPPARSMCLLMQVRGYGLSADAHHVTQPAPDGRGAILAMQRAFQGSGVPKSALAYINAHATSTPLGDAVEAASIAKLFGLPGCGAAGEVLSNSAISGALQFSNQQVCCQAF